jgi:hypothetical protein
MPGTRGTPELVAWLANCEDAAERYGGQSARYWEWIEHVRAVLKERELDSTDENLSQVAAT